MNLVTFENEVFGNILGHWEAADRYNNRRQQIRDALQKCVRQLVCPSPHNWRLTKIATLSLVPGTTIYTLDDACEYPLAFWTEDTAAHPVNLKSFWESVRDGSRNSNQLGASLGPYDVSWYPRTTVAAASGLSGAGEGASITEGLQAVTFGASGPALTSALTNRIIKFNGEEEDYIFTQTGAHAGTLDKPFRSRLYGSPLATDNTGGNYTNVSWQIGPKDAYRIEIRPGVVAAQTLYYAYAARPRRAINDSDTPDIPERWHHLLPLGAGKYMKLSADEAAAYGAYLNEWEQGRKEFLATDADESASPSTPEIPMLDGYVGRTWNRGIQPGQYFRG